MKAFLTKILAANVGIALVGITTGETITSVEAKGIVEISTADRTRNALGQGEPFGLWGGGYEEIIQSRASKADIFGSEKSDGTIGESNARFNERVIAITKPKPPPKPKPKPKPK